MTNDFKMIVFKQLTISIKTQHDNKINVLCNANQQNVTHAKHDHQYRRNFKSLNIIWCIVCFFCIYWDAWSFFLSRNTSSVLHSMLNAKHFEIVYVAGSMGFVPTGHRPIKSRHFYQAGDNTFDIYVFIRLRRQSFSDLVWGPWLQKTKCLLSGGPCNKTFTTLQCPSVPRIYLILILKKWKVCVD